MAAPAVSFNQAIFRLFVAAWELSVPGSGDPGDSSIFVVLADADEIPRITWLRLQIRVSFCWVLNGTLSKKNEEHK